MRARRPADAGTGGGDRLVALTVVLTVLALGLRVWRLPAGATSGIPDYDDGVYVGSALSLSHGRFPYLDYDFVHPPGITALLAPIGWLAQVIGPAHAVVIATWITALVGTATVPLTMRLLRHRGLVAAGVGGAIVALHPDSIVASAGVLLEPWTVVCCLVGLCLVLDDGALAGPSRQRWGGVAFGVAAAVKIWALAPGAAVAVVCVVAARGSSARRRTAFPSGVLVGFAILTVPFAVRAPGAFFRDVFVTQLQRSADDRTDLGFRVVHLVGVAEPDGSAPAGIVVAVASAMLAALVIAWRLRNRQPGPGAVVAALAAGVTVAMLLVPDTFYWHYAAFATPFLALVAGQCVRRRRLRTSSRGPARVVAATLLGAIVVTASAVITATHVTDTAAAHGEAAVLRRLIPSGSCVVTTSSAATIRSDRFSPTTRRCPAPLDAFGSVLVQSSGRSPDPTALRNAATHRMWARALHDADAVYLATGPTDLFPSGRDTTGYLSTHFRRIDADGLRGALYLRRTTR